ncbi:MAG: vitamin K epoxide reductase family protein [Polyangiales bacterium]
MNHEHHGTRSRSNAQLALAIALVVAVLDCVYLSWRYLALHGLPSAWVVAHTGLCSWTEAIDCDRVLVTPQARAFFVPNATLGLGFFAGAAHWWFRGVRRYPEHRLHLARTLAFWLGVATLFTLRFWWLLIHLPALCPFCPWNHVFTYIAFASALLVWRDEQRSHTGPHAPWQQLVPHVLISISPLVAINAAWWLLVRANVVDAGPTIARW